MTTGENPIPARLPDSLPRRSNRLLGIYLSTTDPVLPQNHHTIPAKAGIH